MLWKVTELYFSIIFTCADTKIINALIRTFIYLAHDQLYSNDKKFLSEMIYTFQSCFWFIYCWWEIWGWIWKALISFSEKSIYIIFVTRCRNKEKEKEFCIDFLFEKKGNQMKEERRKIVFILIVIGIGTFITLW